MMRVPRQRVGPVPNRNPISRTFGKVFQARRFHEEVLFHRDADRFDPQQADAKVPVKDLCRQAGISVATYYQWKSKYERAWKPPSCAG